MHEYMTDIVADDENQLVDRISTHETEADTSLKAAQPEDNDEYMDFSNETIVDGPEMDETEPPEEELPEDGITETILDELGYHEEFECWEDVFASLCAPALGDRYQHLKKFMESVKFLVPEKSLEAVDDFLHETDVETWPNYDNDISSRWDLLVESVGRLSNGKIDIRYLTKPSGPLRATLAFIWHYPTFRSRRIVRGSAFDPSNPSLLWLAKKVGLDSSIRVQNRIYVRHNYQREISWEDEIPGWPQIDQEFLNFNRWLNSFSRVIVLVGEANCRPQSIREMIPLTNDEEMVKVPLNVNCHMYGEIPYCMVVQNSDTGKIRQLILLSYHSSAWLGNHLRVIPALHDCLYNTACELAQIWYEDGELFSREACRVSGAVSGA